MFCAQKDKLLQHQKDLDNLEVSSTTVAATTYPPTPLPDLNSTWKKVRDIAAILGLDAVYPESGSRGLDRLRQLRQYINTLLLFPFCILSRYFSSSANLVSMPYRWDNTCTIVSDIVERCADSQEFHSCLKTLLDTAIDTPKPLETSRIGEIISVLLSLWTPNCIPDVIIQVLNRWNSESGLRDVLRRKDNIEAYLWGHFAQTLTDTGIGRSAEQQVNVLTALWRLASLSGNVRVSSSSYLGSLSSILEALRSLVRTDPSPLVPQISSITLLLEFRVVSEQAVDAKGTVGQALATFNEPIFPEEAESAAIVPDQIRKANAEQTVSSAQWLVLYERLQSRKDEARIICLTKFLKNCKTNTLPYNPVETICSIEKIGKIEPIGKGAAERWKGTVHPQHQMGFAKSLRGADRVLDAVIHSWCWNLYAKYPSGVSDDPKDGSPWLDNQEARQIIKETFHEYAQTLSESTDSANIIPRLQSILQGLASWHPETSVPVA